MEQYSRSPEAGQPVTVNGKVIPILPCPDIKNQVTFYQQLGFEVLGVYTSPNPYASIQYGDIELHFYGTRKMIPTENPSMCFIRVEDVDAMYNAFVNRLKQSTGKVPRAGIPRITKLRDLVSDRRFTLTDSGGNTIFIGSPVQGDSTDFFRTLKNDEFSKRFAVLYDVLYSKEDASLAMSMISRFDVAKEVLNDLDKAKLLLVILEIQRQQGQPLDDSELKSLLKVQSNKGDEGWNRVKAKYRAILQGE